MKNIIIFLSLVSALFFAGCQSNSASLRGRSLNYDPSSANAMERIGIDLVGEAFMYADYSTIDTVDYNLDGYPLFKYESSRGDTILSVIINHSGTNCYGGLVSVNNTSLYMNSWNSIDLNDKNTSNDAYKKPVSSSKPLPPVTYGTVTHVDSPRPTPREPNPPFRVENGYTVCEIVPEGPSSRGAEIYNTLRIPY